jgi:hypothetical protein
LEGGMNVSLYKLMYQSWSPKQGVWVRTFLKYGSRSFQPQPGFPSFSQAS